MSKVKLALSNYSAEIDIAAYSFYAWKSINNIATNDQDILRAINRNALSWQVLTHSLQCTFFVALGRLFDTNSSALSIYQLIRACTDNIQEFSRASLRERKTEGGPEPEWLQEYMQDTYEPTASDFRSLRRDVTRWARLFARNYQPIRHKIFAHKDMDVIGSSHSLFARTNIGELQDMLSFLHGVERYVFDLFHDGRKRDLKDFRGHEEERVRDDVQSLLSSLKAGVIAEQTAAQRTGSSFASASR